MTTARLKPAPADGHGLTPSVVDKVYNDLTAGKDPGTIVAIAVLKPVEHGEKLTAAGTTRWVRFEAAKVEPVHDSHDAEQLRWQIQQAWDVRHAGTMLPLDFDGRTEDEQRRFLLGQIEDDWAKDENLTPADIAERWRTTWGIEANTVPLDGSFPHPDYRKAAAHHLKEFCFQVGVIADGEPDDDEDEQPTSGKDAAAGE